MTLRTLSFAVQTPAVDEEPSLSRVAVNQHNALSRSCVFCGAPTGAWLSVTGNGKPGRPDQVPNDSVCPLCRLVCHLERPHIDDEAVLVWLPEISQPALNTIVRELHIQLRALGDPLEAGAAPRHNTPERYPLHHARTAFAERSAGAAERLGTTKPSDLGSALHRLSPAARRHQDALVGGLRLLPLGRFFQGSEDIYPSIVDGWLTEGTGFVGQNSHQPFGA